MFIMKGRTMNKIQALSNLTSFRFDGTELGLADAACRNHLPIGSVIRSPIGIFLFVKGHGNAHEWLRLVRLLGPCPRSDNAGGLI